MRVALQVTCVNDAMFPDTGKAMVRLLERLGHAPDRIHSAVAAALTMNLSMLDVQHVLYRQQTMDDAQRAAVAEHPLASRRAREQGRVDVRVRVDEQGRRR